MGAEQSKDKVHSINIAESAVTNPDGVRSAYSNNAVVRMTSWDVRMLFTEVVLYADSHEVQYRANVVMTPAHAKAFAAILSNSIAQWEKDNGEIQWPQAGATKAKQ